jgi:hypothetical protein
LPFQLLLPVTPQRPSGCFPEGQIGQPFYGWLTRQRFLIRAFQRPYPNGFSRLATIKAKADEVSTLKRAKEIVIALATSRKTAGLIQPAVKRLA